MRGTKILALAVTLMLAGVILNPGATYAGEVGEPPLPPVEGGEEGGGETGEPPLPGEDEDVEPSLPGEDEEEVAPVSVYDRAIASLEGLNTAEALQAALDAVDAQIPNWNVWKYVPYAIEQVRNGIVCSAKGDAKILTECRATGFDAHYYMVKNLIPWDESESVKPDEAYWERGDVKQLMAMNLADLLAYAKGQSLYESDEDFKSMVDLIQHGYEEGMAYLQDALTSLRGTSGAGKADVITAIVALPEAEAYGITDGDSLEGDGLYAAYARVYDYLANNLLEYNEWVDSAADAYAKLVVAATEINPDFAVDLSGVAKATPAAPATGALSDEELSATIAKVAVTGVAVAAVAGGVMLTAKRYVFSPLKRK